MKWKISPGLKFGCDFLMYAMDSNEAPHSHAAYCAHVIDADRLLSMKEISGICRLSGSVKKATLFIPSNYWKEAHSASSDVIDIDPRQCIVLSSGIP